MTHGFYSNDTMVSTRRLPWHGMGKVLPHAPSIPEAIRDSGLSWNPQLVDLTTPDGQKSDYRGLVRDDTGKLLATVGSRYTPISQDAAFAVFAPWVDSGAVEIETAGSLFGGRKVWILARFADVVDVAADDQIRPYILLANSHDGTMAIRAGLTAVRVVCNNTLSAAVGRGSTDIVSIRHTASAQARLDDWKQDLEAAHKQLRTASGAWRELARTPLRTGDDVATFVGTTFGAKTRDDISPKHLTAVERLLEEGEGANLRSARGTHWGLYQALTAYTSHERGRDAEKRLDSVGFGSGAALNKRALDVAYVMATRKFSIEDVFGYRATEVVSVGGSGRTYTVDEVLGS
jgi:phage/plasmid-like protein (TIGR03299 family)